MNNTHTLTPEEESKFWEKLGEMVNVDDIPVEDSDSYICYNPEERKTSN